jgi:hypothetical protein
MVSGYTREAMTTDFGFRELGRLRVVGKEADAVTVYEPMYLKEFDAKRELYAAFAEGLALFYDGKLGEAETAFAQIARFDPPAGAYHRKCKDLLASMAQSPDGGEAMMREWQGIWVMTKK